MLSPWPRPEQPLGCRAASSAGQANPASAWTTVMTSGEVGRPRDSEAAPADGGLMAPRFEDVSAHGVTLPSAGEVVRRVPTGVLDTARRIGPARGRRDDRAGAAGQGTKLRLGTTIAEGEDRLSWIPTSGQLPPALCCPFGRPISAVWGTTGHPSRLGQRPQTTLNSHSRRPSRRGPA